MYPTRSTILVNRRETRFHEDEYSSSKDVDVSGLEISVTSQTVIPPSSLKKSKENNETKEIIVDAHLRLKAGIRYGLVGRNGTGKSTLLQAISERLIPGVSYTLRIGSLQQINVDDHGANMSELFSELSIEGDQHKDLSSLDYVVHNDASRDDTLREFKALSKVMDVDSKAQIKAFREIKHARLTQRLDQMQKTANLRSGARGFKARKELAVFEEQVQKASLHVEEDVNTIDPVDLSNELQSVSEHFYALEAQVNAIKDDDVEAAARKVLKGLGFNRARILQPFRTLSGGWKTRCQLASVLIKHVDIMLLDEATNYLDLAGIVWLERYLKEINRTRGTTIVIVSHDREFINNICEETIILKDKKLEYFKGNLAEYQEDREARKLDLIRKKDATDRQKEHFENTIAENIRQGKKTGDTNRLRQAKSRKKRVDERTGMQTSAKGFRFKLTRDGGGAPGTQKRHDIVLLKDDRQISLEIPKATELRYPGSLISLDGVSHRYKPNQPVILEDVKLSINIGDRVGILGLNGSGKTTLMRILVRDLESTKGTVTYHPRVKVGWYTQHAVEDLRAQGRSEPTLTALTLLSRTAGDVMTEGDARGLLGSVGLPGALASEVPVAKLSGGQLVRLAFTLIIWEHPHILILDEISTHLDFDTIEALKDALLDFDGAIVLVSHDRYLLKSLVEGIDSDDEYEGLEFTTKLTRRSAMYALRNMRLEHLEDGISGFEGQLAKTLKF